MCFLIIDIFNPLYLHIKKITLGIGVIPRVLIIPVRVKLSKKEFDTETDEGMEKCAFMFEEADKKAKKALTECFGASNDFDTIFEGANAFSPTDTGNWVITNFIAAITPVVEKEVTAFTKEKAKRQAAKVKQNKAKRSKK